MPNPSRLNVVGIRDVLELSEVVYSASVDVDVDGSIFIMLRGKDESEVGSIVIENHEGNLDFHYWNKLDHDYGNDPTTSFTMWTPTPGTDPTFTEES